MNWDKEQVYDEKIAPLMTQIIQVCTEHSIPFVAQFQYANSERGADYCRSSHIDPETASQDMRFLARVAKESTATCLLSEETVTYPDGKKVVQFKNLT